MHLSRTLAIIGLSFICAHSAQAKNKRLRIMVLDLPGDKAFEGNIIKVVNSFVAKNVRDQGFDVVTQADIATILGVERQKQLLGCSESSCLAEVGGAMGADYIVHGELASLSRDTALTLTLNDNKGRAISEVGEVVKGQDAESLLDAVNREVPKLVQPLLNSTKPVANLTPGSSAAAAPVLSISVVSTAEESSHTKAYVAGGVGALCLIGSGVIGLIANAGNTTLKSEASTSPITQAQDANTDLRTTVQDEAWVSTGLLAAGVVAVGLGVVWLITGSPGPAHVSSVAGGHPALAWEF